MQSFGRRVRKERRDREWSQRFLGKLIGVSGSSIFLYEKGETYPRKDKVQRLEAVLGIKA
ncbi:unnamed protein product, partial [marine sediment metagenome]